MQGYNKTDLTLYSYFSSSSAWRVRTVLHHKKLQVQYKFIHLNKNQQKSQQYLKINPNAAVPSLVLPNGQILIQSMAICEYLQEIYPEYPLLPKDPIKRAHIRGFCEVINSGLQPYQNRKLLDKVGQDYGADKLKFKGYWIQKGMNVIQALLAKSKAGKYCFGDEITLADVFFYPQVKVGAARFGVNIEEYPLSKKVLQNLSKLQAFRLSQPQNQLDSH